MVDEDINVRKYYEGVWSNPKRLMAGDYELLGGFHYGFFEKGIKDVFEAMYNMNDYVGRLLDLDKIRSGKILDAGCGVGSTSIYLAEKYPSIEFTGITIASAEIELAKKFIKTRNVDNFKVIKKDYLDTDFPNNYFDGVFALESISYATSKRNFLNEMHRVLKPGGRLVVIDGFRKETPPNSIIKQLYDFHRNIRGGSDVPELESFKFLLNEKDFKEIIVKNISKNIRRHFFNLFFIRLPRYFPRLLKECIIFRKYGSKRLNSYVRGMELLDFFFGVIRLCTYNSIVAIKQITIGD